jgi:transposase
MNEVEVLVLFQRWQLDLTSVREQVYRAPTPRERERWHALWLLAQGWSQVQVAEALERDAHTVGEWVAGFRQSGPASLAFEQTGGSPPPSTQSSRLR